MNISLRSRYLEAKRSVSVFETTDRALSARVIESGGEDKNKLDAAFFSALCGRAFSNKNSRIPYCKPVSEAEVEKKRSIHMQFTILTFHTKK